MNKNRNYRINSKIVTLGVVAVILLVNLFVTLLVEKYPIKIDLTTGGIYNLSVETKEMLEDYDTPAEIYFVGGASYEQSYTDLRIIGQVLEKYGQYAKTIKYTSINADENLTFGTKYLSDEVTAIRPGNVIVDSGDKFKVFSNSDLISRTSTGSISSIRIEQKINSALKYVAGDTQLNAYVIVGHNEAELAGLVEKLADDGYTVNNLNLAHEEIPDDASLLIINSPTIDYTAAEIAKLDNYLQNSGRAYINFKYSNRDLPAIFEYLTSWGFALLDEIAIDPSSDNTIPQLQMMVAEYAESDITSLLSENERFVGYAPYAKTMQLLFTENNGIKTEALLKTSDEAYSTSDFHEYKNISSDKTNQIVSAIAVKEGETPDKDSIVYLSGTTALMEYPEESLTDFGFANYDYVTAVLSYLSGDMSDYSIMPKYISSGRLFINQVQFLVLCGIFVVLLPLMILIYGIIVWFKRRNL